MVNKRPPPFLKQVKHFCSDSQQSQDKLDIVSFFSGGKSLTWMLQNEKISSMFYRFISKYIL